MDLSPEEREVTTELGNRIKTLRKAKGWTQEKLAQEAGVTFPTVNKAEKGRRMVELGTMNKIAAALGVSLARLYFHPSPADGAHDQWVARELNPEPTDRWSVAPEIRRSLVVAA